LKQQPFKSLAKHVFDDFGTILTILELASGCYIFTASGMVYSLPAAAH
jgi:hypothetical protein